MTLAPIPEPSHPDIPQDTAPSLMPRVSEKGTAPDVTALTSPTAPTLSYWFLSYPSLAGAPRTFLSQAWWV